MRPLRLIIFALIVLVLGSDISLALQPPKQVEPTEDQLQRTLKAFVDLGWKRCNESGQRNKQIIPVFENDDATDEGIKELPDVPFTFGLYLAGRNFTDSGMKELAHFNNLSLLIISGTSITDRGLKEFDTLKNLSSLQLSDTKITDVGMMEIVKYTSLSKLTLTYNKITDLGLMGITNLKNLSYIDLTWASPTARRR